MIDILELWKDDTRRVLKYHVPSPISCGICDADKPNRWPCDAVDYAKIIVALIDVVEKADSMFDLDYDPGMPSNHVLVFGAYQTAREALGKEGVPF